MRRILAFHRPGWAACLVCAIVAMAFGTVSQARAQYASAGDWNRTTDTMAGALGVHYGKLGGHGLSFRYPLHWYLYLQTSGGIWHTADHKRHNVGAQLDYILRQDQRLRLYVTGGAAYFYHKERTSLDGEAENWNLDAAWNTGGGIGVEFLQGERWSLQFEADFVHDGGTGDTKLVPQVGLYFYW
ncbi:hypothetical protein GW813_09295 [bacterium]|nr:hypothetical protein [bacterium]PIV81243.1 MAG: hypothetical protein COW53_05365 [bacterium CG17_big_fil_post_rev_8_21_14_2_50_64_8]